MLPAPVSSQPMHVRPQCNACGSIRTTNIGASSQKLYYYRCNDCKAKWHQTPPHLLNSATATQTPVHTRGSYTCKHCGQPKLGHTCTKAGAPPPINKVRDPKRLGKVQQCSNCHQFGHKKSKCTQREVNPLDRVFHFGPKQPDMRPPIDPLMVPLMTPLTDPWALASAPAIPAPVAPPASCAAPAPADPFAAPAAPFAAPAPAAPFAAPAAPVVPQLHFASTAPDMQFQPICESPVQLEPTDAEEHINTLVDNMDNMCSNCTETFSASLLSCPCGIRKMCLLCYNPSGEIECDEICMLV